MAANELTAERVRELLHYAPDTGVLTWRATMGRSALAGSVAGTCGRYVNVKIGQRRYYAHRLAWLYMTGEWPRVYIDHRNGDGLDNRFANLREATGSQNQANKIISKVNSSGVKGVHWFARTQKWRAEIKANGRSVHLGYFTELSDAAAARAKAEREHHGQFRQAA